jgi:hypothetical protein
MDALFEKSNRLLDNENKSNNSSSRVSSRNESSGNKSGNSSRNKTTEIYSSTSPSSRTIDGNICLPFRSIQNTVV